MKNEQSPQSRMTEGLQRYVLRLSTAGCTVDVGNCDSSTKGQWALLVRSALQQNASATQICELGLQGFDLRFAHR